MAEQDGEGKNAGGAENPEGPENNPANAAGGESRAGEGMGFLRHKNEKPAHGPNSKNNRAKEPMGFDPQRYAEILRRMRAEAEERDRIARRLLESVFGTD